MSSFGREYVKLYEMFYKGKDYASEARLITQLIKKYNHGTKKILDYGCGTGNHAAAFLSKGYEVSGIDKNPYMLAKAKRKFKGNKKVNFYSAGQRGRVREGSVGACTLLFDVLSYMNTNKELVDFLNYVRRVLVKNGLFVFDFWYGPGILNLKPEKRWKEYALGDRKILRLTTPRHNAHRCIVDVTHQVLVFRNKRLLTEFDEVHSMRYFFKNEIELLLDKSGFKILKFGTWQNINKPPTVGDWSALVLAQVIK